MFKLGISSFGKNKLFSLRFVSTLKIRQSISKGSVSELKLQISSVSNKLNVQEKGILNKLSKICAITGEFDLAYDVLSYLQRQEKSNHINAEFYNDDPKVATKTTVVKAGLKILINDYLNIDSGAYEAIRAYKMLKSIGGHIDLLTGEKLLMKLCELGLIEDLLTVIDDFPRLTLKMLILLSQPLILSGNTLKFSKILFQQLRRSPRSIPMKSYQDFRDIFDSIFYAWIRRFICHTRYSKDEIMGICMIHKILHRHVEKISATSRNMDTFFELTNKMDGFNHLKVQTIRIKNVGDDQLNDNDYDNYATENFTMNGFDNHSFPYMVEDRDYSILSSLESNDIQDLTFEMIEKQTNSYLLFHKDLFRDVAVVDIESLEYDHLMDMIEDTTKNYYGGMVTMETIDSNEDHDYDDDNDEFDDEMDEAENDDENDEDNDVEIEFDGNQFDEEHFEATIKSALPSIQNSNDPQVHVLSFKDEHNTDRMITLVSFTGSSNDRWFQQIGSTAMVEEDENNGIEKYMTMELGTHHMMPEDFYTSSRDISFQLKQRRMKKIDFWNSFFE